jgi:hypothetical protein
VVVEEIYEDSAAQLAAHMEVDMVAAHKEVDLVAVVLTHTELDSE